MWFFVGFGGAFSGLAFGAPRLCAAGRPRSPALSPAAASARLLLGPRFVLGFASRFWGSGVSSWLCPPPLYGGFLRFLRGSGVVAPLRCWLITCYEGFFASFGRAPPVVIFPASRGNFGLWWGWSSMLGGVVLVCGAVAVPPWCVFGGAARPLCCGRGRVPSLPVLVGALRASCGGPPSAAVRVLGFASLRLRGLRFSAALPRPPPYAPGVPRGRVGRSLCSRPAPPRSAPTRARDARVAVAVGLPLVCLQWRSCCRGFAAAGCQMP